MSERRLPDELYELSLAVAQACHDRLDLCECQGSDPVRHVHHSRANDGVITDTHCARCGECKAFRSRVRPFATSFDAVFAPHGPIEYSWYRDARFRQVMYSVLRGHVLPRLSSVPAWFYIYAGPADYCVAFLAACDDENEQVAREAKQDAARFKGTLDAMNGGPLAQADPPLRRCRTINATGTALCSLLLDHPGGHNFPEQKGD